MKKNNKGFTLVELLAVAVILIIIIFIAINKLKGSTQKTKMNTVKANAITYVKAANDLASVDSLTSARMRNSVYTKDQLDDLGIKINGEKPKDAQVFFDNFEVSYACVQYGGYTIVYKDGKYQDVSRGKCDSSALYAEYDLTKQSQKFVAEYDGVYRLEVWGAQGGYGNEKYVGGYGGYSVANLKLEAGDTLYIQVGEQGVHNGTTNTYNGGGYGTASNGSSGGGATSIALSNGQLSTVSQSDVIIVAGGGGGGDFYQNAWASAYGGHGGGYIGVGSTPDGWSAGGSLGGTQTEGGRYGLSDRGAQHGNTGSYGQGANTSGSRDYAAGGGGGFYGGGSARHAGGAGGSGYIGYSELTDGVMYCYNCVESDEDYTKTISTTCVEEEPTSNCAKKGNGYAKITIASSN